MAKTNRDNIKHQKKTLLNHNKRTEKENNRKRDKNHKSLQSKTRTDINSNSDQTTGLKASKVSNIKTSDYNPKKGFVNSSTSTNYMRNSNGNINNIDSNSSRQNLSDIDILTPNELKALVNNKLHSSNQVNPANHTGFTDATNPNPKNFIIKNSMTKESTTQSPARALAVNSSLFKRFLAFTIDIFVIILILLPVYDQILSQLPAVDESNMNSLSYVKSLNQIITDKIKFRLNLITAIVIWLYFALQESLIGQTLGKALLGVYVISLKNPNSKISFYQATIRVLLFLPLFDVLWLIDILTIIFNRQNRRLMEYLSHTITVDIIKTRSNII
ncbi:MAG: hypothetical protein GWP09_00945 [Nitrospiraceae bacterium]|nr:hypothetical protein [Nitrospiraceae bacterium]